MKEFKNSLTNIRISPNKKMQNKENQNNDIEKTFGSIDNNQNDSRFEKQSNVTVNVKKKMMINNNQKKINIINSKDQFVSIFIINNHLVKQFASDTQDRQHVETNESQPK